MGITVVTVCNSFNYFPAPLVQKFTLLGLVEKKTAQKFGFSLSDIQAVVMMRVPIPEAALTILEEKHRGESSRYTSHTFPLVVNHVLKKDPQISKALAAGKCLNRTLQKE